MTAFVLRPQSDQRTDQQIFAVPDTTGTLRIAPDRDAPQRARPDGADHQQDRRDDQGGIRQIDEGESPGDRLGQIALHEELHDHDDRAARQHRPDRAPRARPRG